MTVYWGIVVCFEEFPTFVQGSGDDLSSVLEPYSLNFLQAVGVDPRLQSVFVLSFRFVVDLERVAMRCPYEHVIGEDRYVAVVVFSLVVVGSS
jgi:hypothetical protein